ncbi:hypothetical protein [Streptomyces niveus]|uniref:hypothetical protein n=1 Tax=Streptomyces niveus TaxID=193462 RepID=UPI00386E5C05
MSDRIPLDHLTSDQLDALYDQLDQRWARIVKQSHLLQELKRDNFALRMDIVSLLEGAVAPSDITPGQINAGPKEN